MEEKEVKKRKGYKDIKKQIEADKRYLASNPEAKEKKKISAMKSNGKRFIKEFATLKELEEIEILIKNRKGEINMNKKELEKQLKKYEGRVYEIDNPGKDHWSLDLVCDIPLLDLYDGPTKKINDTWEEHTIYSENEDLCVIIDISHFEENEEKFIKIEKVIVE